MDAREGLDQVQDRSRSSICETDLRMIGVQNLALVKALGNASRIPEPPPRKVIIPRIPIGGGLNRNTRLAR